MNIDFKTVIQALWPFQYQFFKHPLKYVGSILVSTDDVITNVFTSKPKDKFVDKRRAVVSHYVVPLRKEYKIIDYKNNDSVTSVFQVHKHHQILDNPIVVKKVKSIFDRAASAHLNVEHLIATQKQPPVKKCKKGDKLCKKNLNKHDSFEFSKVKKQQKKEGQVLNVSSSKKIPKVELPKIPKSKSVEIKQAKADLKRRKKLEKQMQKSRQDRTEEDQSKDQSTTLDQRYQQHKKSIKSMRQEGIDKYIVTKQELRQREANINAKKKAKLEADRLKNAPKPPPEHVHWHDDEDLLLNWIQFLGDKYTKAKLNLADKLELLENYITVWKAEDEEGNLPKNVDIDTLEQERENLKSEQLKREAKKAVKLRVTSG